MPGKLTRKLALPNTSAVNTAICPGFWRDKKHICTFVIKSAVSLKRTSGLMNIRFSADLVNLKIVCEHEQEIAQNQL